MKGVWSANGAAAWVELLGDMLYRVMVNADAARAG
jgi:hypothetical protein